MAMQSSADLEFGFVRDLVFLLKEAAAGAKAAATTGDNFDNGRHFAYFEVIELIISQAQAFQIDLAKIELEGFDPYRDILGISIKDSPASKQ